MLFRYDNTKRGVALLGVVLALLSGVEQTHLLCQRGGCDWGVEHPHDAGECKAPACSHACGLMPQGIAQHAASQAGEIAHRDGTCPCPPECWCQRAPMPQEPPREPAESGEAQQAAHFATQWAATSVVLVKAEPSSSLGELASLAKTSPERCASLCRFLI